MKNLFDPVCAQEIKERLNHLSAESPRLWGKMDAAQAVAHCALALDIPLGRQTPKPAGLGMRIVGRLIKPMVFKDDAPIRRNAPTNPELVISDERDLTCERERLAVAIDCFMAAGPANCSTHPHFLFGKLTPDQWAILMYKHVDHHLRQFGA
ncbi:MAG TPA: DUF1569 domain-containing protein [Terracidiphilus sp.]|nr:DUF1569 domain-containing protein [Terracidiphilus sp.]